ncbi:hypothetical protein F5B22DRAFT_618232 [Xylaria bambusicola]|uniref:uncharacterized protein n=1 Tax=Xylaria bambusicola TaxID=326684 RepID=UPI002007CE2C|nr:uncharacterized protein F5B22DRAFT_618232 [Xylaria bambusicola]KAI0509033.1 hypothetical protein F5B22DRAFT_618232 [Xylaria bambusicola]
MGKDPSETGALPPPDGVIPNFVNPPSIHYIHVAVAIAGLATSAIAVTARTYTRAKVIKRFGLDDCSLLISLAIFAAYVALTITTGEYGQGAHQWDVTVTRFFMLLKYINYIEILYSPLMFFAKFVVMRQIESIFLKHKRDSISHTCLKILIWTNLFFYSGLMLSFILACIPREKIWNPEIPGRCIDNDAALIASSAINILSDFAILFLPLAAIHHLQVAKKSKLKVTAIFAVGGFACIASIVRFVYTIQLSKQTDVTYAIEPFGYWTEIEYATVVLVACFPTFPLLFRHIAQRSQVLFSFSGTASQQRGVEAQTGAQSDHSSVRKLRAPPAQDLGYTHSLESL